MSTAILSLLSTQLASWELAEQKFVGDQDQLSSPLQPAPQPAPAVDLEMIAFQESRGQRLFQRQPHFPRRPDNCIPLSMQTSEILDLFNLMNSSVMLLRQIWLRSHVLRQLLSDAHAHSYYIIKYTKSLCVVRRPDASLRDQVPVRCGASQWIEGGFGWLRGDTYAVLPLGSGKKLSGCAPRSFLPLPSLKHDGDPARWHIAGPLCTRQPYSWLSLACCAIHPRPQLCEVMSLCGSHQATLDVRAKDHGLGCIL
ncbi:hypothetical protein N658DRAFT_494274 [Parathielavia hyrcaniae]|uniref:Uncharacterized protein n=1 Tax=Parathielavia hyrcaniae TaxID=113614 RepID=A0AAN6T4I0_9PEZI|nr:hypothetical protein N658DRAFT_494274 [Parathielavia hyrcaniae]